MKEYNGFNSREEYIRYIKTSLKKYGFRCMVLSVVILVVMAFLGISEMEKVAVVMGFSAKSVMFIAKLITVCFFIGSFSYLMSYRIREDTDDE